MSDIDRHQTLGEFLRKKRAGLSPEDVGMPPGVRRRIPGLRREEVAQLANIGVSWYIRLEQGQDVQPSTQVLGSLAHALKLTSDERRHLFLLADQPIIPDGHEWKETVEPVLQRVLDDLNPSPAYVIGKKWDFLAWNKMAETVFLISEGKPPHEHNILWRLFTDPVRRTIFPDWEQLALGIISEFHTFRPQVTEDPAFETLIDDLLQASDDFRRVWPSYKAPSTVNGHKIIEHPVLGYLDFEHVMLQVPTDPDMRVMIYTPRGNTRSKLKTFYEEKSSFQHE